MQNNGEIKLVEVNIGLHGKNFQFFVPGGLKGPVDGIRWMRSPYDERYYYVVDTLDNAIMLTRFQLEKLVGPILDSLSAEVVELRKSA